MIRGISQAALVLVVGMAAGMSGAAASGPVAQSVDGHHAGHPRFEVGVTHTQRTADFGEPPALRRARRILRGLGTWQAQHIMGFGALNPEPRPGVYHWASLDRRVRLMRSTGGRPVITLCCAPDWMKGGRPGETDWSRLEVAPHRDHFDDFARLAVRVARRYPRVHHFLVWNELKGFYDGTRNRWAYKRYTAFYNTVYDALKRHDPSVQVGGPYVPMDSWQDRDAGGWPSRVRGRWGVLDRRALDVVRYWLSHAHGADFLVVDGSSRTNDHHAPPPRVGARKFAVVTRWLRARSTLPVWWAEFYTSTRRHGLASTPQAVRLALTAMRTAGASVAMLWQPECSGGRLPCVWTSTKRPQGGRSTRYTEVIQRFTG